MAHFERDGIAFQYPETWHLSPESYDTGWGVSVFSPGTAFISISLNASDAPAVMQADAALDAIRDEYKHIDSEPVSDTLAGLPAVGHVAQFFALDLTNTCWIRAAATSWGTLLIYWQASDLEAQNQQVLRAICASLTVADE
jgi:hypothetical protein